MQGTAQIWNRDVASAADERPRAGFTLVEALVSLSITAMCGGALLLAVGTSLDTTQYAIEQTIATGMAQQLLDEIVGRRYSAAGAGPYEPFLGPSATEASAPGRQYTDIDDYNGFRAQPPIDFLGSQLGQDDGVGGIRHANFQVASGYLARWRQEVDVVYVNNTNLTQRLAGGQTSDHRLIEVRIVYVDPSRGPRTLATARRIVAYVPTS